MQAEYKITEKSSKCMQYSVLRGSHKSFKFDRRQNLPY